MSAARGLEVLDLAEGIAGALAGRILADCGADVTTISRPSEPGSVGDRPELTWQIGTARRTLDLTTTDGRDELRRLVAGSDVLIESFRPGQMDEWGLGDDILIELNPMLVHCSVTGYGPDGPMAGELAHEWLVQAYSGIAGDQAGFREGPVPVAVPLASVEAGLLAAAGVLAALVARERGLGRGQRVDTSLLAGSLAMQTAVLCRSEGLPPSAPPQDPLGAMPTFRLYECADGRWIQIACLQPTFFQRLLEALGLPDVLRDRRFEHAPRFSSEEDTEALIDVLRTRFRQRTCDVWLAALVAAGVPCAPAQDARELWHDPLFRESGVLVEQEDPRLGRVRRVGPVFVGEEGARAPSSLPPMVVGGAPLEGLRILELGGYQAGPMAGRLLADLGADVVKVEPLEGDPFRTAGNVFLALNHGKRSFAVDLKTLEGQVAVRRLAETCAAVVHNLRPGVAERDGLGYAQLAAANPGLVYVHVSGFGTDAAVAGRPAYDPLGAALAGVQRAQGGPAGENPPSLVRTAVCDVGAGTAAAVAAIAGLLGRLRHGRGGRQETSLLRMGAAAVAETALWYEGRPEPPELDGGQTGAGPLCRLYPTADGWLFLVARPDDWPRLRSTLGLASDREPSALAEALADRSLPDCLAVVRGAGAAAMPVRFDFVRRFDVDPQVRAQGLAAEVVHPAYGLVTFVGPPIRLSVTPSRVGQPAPALGEHTDALLAEIGYDVTERMALREQTIVSGAADWPVV